MCPHPPQPPKKKETTAHTPKAEPELEDLLALALRLSMEWHSGTSLFNEVQGCVDGDVVSLESSLFFVSLSTSSWETRSDACRGSRRTTAKGVG